MTVYQALQLNAAGSKNLIRKTEDRKQKRKWKAVYGVKVILTVAFCFVFVTAFSMVFGTENSIAGVVTLLALLTVRQANFGIKTSGGVVSLLAIFGILMAGPRLANLLSPVLAFAVNLACIFLIMVLGCHNVIMSNQSTFVLGYLLLYGYDVTGDVFRLRLAALALGGLLCAAVFWKNHRKETLKRSFGDIFREFDISSLRTQWQIKITLAIALSMLLASLLHFPRVMWIGITVMSLMVPFSSDVYYRAKRRAPFNIVGCVLFFILYQILPEPVFAYVGIIGGIGVGFSAGYAAQTIFNVFGAVYIAMGMFGLYGAMLLRMIASIGGTLYVLLFGKITDMVQNWYYARQSAVSEMV